MSSRRLLLLASLALALAVALPAAASARKAHRGHKPHRARLLLAQANAGAVPYAGNEQAMRWADEVAQRRHLDPAWVRQAIAQAQYLPVVVRLMQPAPAGTRKNWRAYRNRFIDPVRIAAGVRFWQENQDALRRAEERYGVPPEIIVGIIGVETIYGQQMGNFRVLDALATLAFNFPADHPRAAERTEYFRNELEHFLMLQSLRGEDPTQPVGSYAGAIGMTQFMPSSILKWAVDFDGDGRIDLAHSAADAIGSVANYFNSYGWQRGVPAYYPVSFDPARLDKDALLAPDILPTFSVASFTAKGAVLGSAAQQYPGSLALVELQNGDDPPQYVAGTENFYVITRYNWSSYYAMAVIELGQAVKDVVMAKVNAPAAPPDEPAASPAAPDASAAAAQVPAPAASAASAPAPAASDPIVTPAQPPASEPAGESAPAPTTAPTLRRSSESGSPG